MGKRREGEKGGRKEEGGGRIDQETWETHGLDDVASNVCRALPSRTRRHALVLAAAPCWPP